MPAKAGIQFFATDKHQELDPRLREDDDRKTNPSPHAHNHA